jgi:flagellar biogenesis protein FliO
LELLPQLSAVLTVFALLGLTLWWLRKRGALQFNAKLPFRLPSARTARQRKVLEHVDALKLSPTHSLSVVKMGDRAILIGTSPSGFCLVESSSWKTLHAQMQTPADEVQQ